MRRRTGVRTVIESLVPSTDLSTDDLLTAISNERRRHVILTVAVVGPVTQNELSQAVAAAENDLPPEDLSRRQEQRARTTLYQNHLDILEDAGLVEWVDQRVHPTDATEDVAAIIKAVDGATAGEPSTHDAATEVGV